jgi:hypothetical protein
MAAGLSMTGGRSSDFHGLRLPLGRRRTLGEPLSPKVERRDRGDIVLVLRARFPK